MSSSGDKGNDTFEPMDSRRYRWRDQAREHEVALVWVPGTDGRPYHFGHGPIERAIDVAGFFMATTPVTQAFWQRVMGGNPAVPAGPPLPG